MSKDYSLSEDVWSSENLDHLERIGNWLFLIDDDDVFHSACHVEDLEKVEYFKKINDFYRHDPYGAKKAVENAMVHLGLIEAPANTLEALYDLMVHTSPIGL